MSGAIHRGSDKRILQVLIEEGSFTYTALRLRMMQQKPYFTEVAVSMGTKSLLNKKQIVKTDELLSATDKGIEDYNKLFKKEV